MSRECSISSRLIATMAALAIIIATGPAPALAAREPGSTSSLSGRIFLSDARTPVGDAVVKAFHHGTEVIRASEASQADGSYSIEGLEPGEYDLGVSTAEGIYIVADSIRFASGQRRAASFALRAGEQGQDPPQGEGEKKADSDEEGKKEETQAEPGTKKEKKLKRARAAGAAVRTPLVATGIVIGSALVIGAVANNVANDDDGSPNR